MELANLLKGTADQQNLALFALSSSPEDIAKHLDQVIAALDNKKTRKNAALALKACGTSAKSARKKLLQYVGGKVAESELLQALLAVIECDISGIIEKYRSLQKPRAVADWVNLLARFPSLMECKHDLSRLYRDVATINVHDEKYFEKLTTCVKGLLVIGDRKNGREILWTVINGIKKSPHIKDSAQAAYFRSILEETVELLKGTFCNLEDTRVAHAFKDLTEMDLGGLSVAGAFCLLERTSEDHKASMVEALLTQSCLPVKQAMLTVVPDLPAEIAAEVLPVVADNFISPEEPGNIMVDGSITCVLNVGKTLPADKRNLPFKLFAQGLAGSDDGELTGKIQKAYEQLEVEAFCDSCCSQ